MGSGSGLGLDDGGVWKGVRMAAERMANWITRGE